MIKVSEKKSIIITSNFQQFLTCPNLLTDCKSILRMSICSLRKSWNCRQIISDIRRSTAKSRKGKKNGISQAKGNGIDVEEFNDRRRGGFVINVMPVKGHANSLGILSREMRNRKRGRDCRLD